MEADLRSLIEEFARKAREFSDAVARLGSAEIESEKILQILDEAKLRHCVVGEAEERLEFHLRRGVHRAEVRKTGT